MKLAHLEMLENLIADVEHEDSIELAVKLDEQEKTQCSNEW